MGRADHRHDNLDTGDVAALHHFSSSPERPNATMLKAHANNKLLFTSGTDGLIGLIQTVLDPLVTVGMLVAILALYDVPWDESYKMTVILTFLVSFVAFEPPDLCRARRLVGLWAQGRGVAVSWLILVAILLFAAYAAKYSEHFSRQAFLTWFFVTPVVIVAMQEMMRVWVARFYRSHHNARTVVIAVASNVGQRLAAQLLAHPHLGMNLQGYFDDRSAERLGTLNDTPVLGKLADIAHYCAQQRVDRIYVALPMVQQQRVTELLESLKDTTASIYFVPDVYMFDLIQARISEVNGIPVLGIRETPLHGINGMMKRLFDVVVSVIILLLLLPVMLGIALGVKLSSSGPVLFKQRRYGVDGEEIVVYKFRSMTVCEDGGHVVQAQRGDKRVTPWGAFIRRTSLDELPQFINVLQGRMSIVGPRPHAVAHNEQYRKLISGYMIRHKVKPGISGWAQVNGFRGETDTLDKMKSRIEHDLDYLRYWSMALDIKIILRTALIVIRDRNAY